MTVRVELTPQVQADLLAQAQARGMSLEAFAEEVLREKSRETAPVSPNSGQPFWKRFTSQVHDLPDAIFERLPPDGATEHDHYLYGAPKRNL